MIDGTRYQFRLWRLQKKKRSLRALYAAHTEALEVRWRADDPGPEKRLKELQDLTDLEIHEVMLVDEQISRLQTTYLLEQAER